MGKHDKRSRLAMELRGDRCRCGSRKKNGVSFCYRCWRRLPPYCRFNLKDGIAGEGYEEAYAEAVEHLSKK